MTQLLWLGLRDLRDVRTLMESSFKLNVCISVVYVGFIQLRWNCQHYDFLFRDCLCDTVVISIEFLVLLKGPLGKFHGRGVLANDFHRIACWANPLDYGHR